MRKTICLIMVMIMLGVGANMTAAEFDKTMLFSADSAIESQCTDIYEYNDVIYNLVYLKERFEKTPQEMQYILDMITSGYDAQTVVDISYFWVDTSEDVTIITKIYNKLPKYEKYRNPIENAFNDVTGYKCGVLDPEDIIYYLEKGITTEDIRTANKLCRKAIFTIQEILEMRIQGKTFKEIYLQMENISGKSLIFNSNPVMDNSSIIRNAQLKTDLFINNNGLYKSELKEAKKELLESKGLLDKHQNGKEMN